MGLKGKIEQWLVARWISNQVKEGTVIGKVWTWLSGKKLVIGTIISLVSDVVSALPVLLPFVVKDAAQVAHIFGVSLTVLGLLHKGYKYLYHEELKKVADQLGVPVANVVDVANVQDVKADTK